MRRSTPISRTCPKCGHELLIRNGRNGQFIGCSAYPECHYTANIDGSKTQFIREVTEWDEHGNPTEISNIVAIPVSKPKICPFKKCDGSGKMPFSKGGKIIPDTFIFCECSEYSNPDRDDHFRETRPEDIDYPVSYSHYRSLCQYHGWTDPGEDNLPPGPDKPAVLPPGAPQPINLTDYQQLKGRLAFVENKMAEMRAARKKKDNPSKYS